MYIAIIENNAIKTVGKERDLFPNTSFPVNGAGEDFLLQNSATKVISSLEVSATQKLVASEPYLQNGKVYNVVVVDKTQEELDYEANYPALEAAAQVRSDRNIKLITSDWTQVADAPVDKTAWAAYRQALRDITTQTGFPSDVVFPNPPL